MRWIGWRLAGAYYCCAMLSGCAGFWDEVSSRDFDLKATMFPPDPMTILNSSNDGDQRAKAMARLQEPRRHGGGEQAQDQVMQLLTTAAQTDPQPVVRRAAIEALGRFQDPRAATALAGAYASTDQLTPEVAYMMKVHSLQALGETKQPSAVDFLVDIAQEPMRNDVAERERGQQRDIRVAAVKALQNFPRSEKTAQAMVALSEKSKDVAIRDRARETYEVVVGHPPTSTPAAAPNSPTPNNNPIQAVGYNKP